MNKEQLIKKLQSSADRWWNDYEARKDSDPMGSTRALGHARGYEGAIAIVKAELMDKEKSE